MRPSVRYGLVFLGGLAVGGAVAGGLVARRWNRDFADWYVVGVAGQADVAREIYAGRLTQLADRIRGTLPTYVHAVEREFRDAKGRDEAYRFVSNVYKTSGVEVPAELKPILASLPERGSSKRPSSRGSAGDAP